MPGRKSLPDTLKELARELKRLSDAELFFMGMVYRFERVEPHGYRDRVGPRELYLEPGLVYVTD